MNVSKENSNKIVDMGEKTKIKPAFGELDFVLKRVRRAEHAAGDQGEHGGVRWMGRPSFEQPVCWNWSNRFITCLPQKTRTMAKNKRSVRKAAQKEKKQLKREHKRAVRSERQQQQKQQLETQVVFRTSRYVC